MSASLLFMNLQPSVVSWMCAEREKGSAVFEAALGVIGGVVGLVD